VRLSRLEVQALEDFRTLQGVRMWPIMRRATSGRRTNVQALAEGHTRDRRSAEKGCLGPPRPGRMILLRSKGLRILVTMRAAWLVQAPMRESPAATPCRPKEVSLTVKKTTSLSPTTLEW
jgi:hypothetical protein